jgi:hypothetical protein
VEEIPTRRDLLYGTENIRHFSGVTPWEAYGKAREAAKMFAALSGVTVPFFQAIGPYAGRITGRQSVDGLKGWRIDLDPGTKRLHVNWWDFSGDPSRRNRRKLLFGANYVTGGGEQLFWEIISHFPLT